MDEDDDEGRAGPRKRKGKSSGSSGGGGAAKKKSGGGGGGGGKKTWSDEAVEALREEVERAGEPELRGDGNAVYGTWDPIREAMQARGFDFNNKQLIKKWLTIKNGKDGPWTDEEVEAFKALVRSQWPEGATCAPKGFFEKIGAQLHPPRAGQHCKVKWAHLGKPLLGNLKKGEFTEAEDAAVLAHVREHGAKEWRLVAKALNRNQTGVRLRYRKLQKRS